MRKTTTALAALAMAASFGVAGAAQAADTTILSLGRFGDLSATHNVVKAHVWVTCSPDTDSLEVSGSLTEVTHGSVQEASADVTLNNGFECTGVRQRITLPIRRPAGEFQWDRGPARFHDVCVTTYDNGNSSSDFAKGRTITVR